MSLWRNIIASLRREKLSAKPGATPQRISLSRAISKAESSNQKRVAFNFSPPEIMTGVVPSNKKVAFAADSNICNFADTAFLPSIYGATIGFPGFPYLATLETRAEFRQMASALSTELTREWIELTSSETAGDETKDKITKLTKQIEEIGLKNVIQTAAEHDCYYGRAQLLIELRGHNLKLPLVPSEKTVAKGSFIGVKPIEAMWTTPAMYNANDPAAPDFYKPPKWFMLGREVHATRLRTIVTRPLPDMLKPAFNFAGMSLSQLAEPYVMNWLRTRQSVSDLISNFSITALKTAMSQTLTGGGDGADIIDRAKLFNANRDNQGLMLLDKDTEELVQVNAPLSGLDKLQAQAQEHMCAVSRLPAIILTGLSPTGLNASSEGEIRVFYDWIAAQQEAHWRKPIQFIIDILQYSMFGSVDPDISFSFVPLFQMSAKEEAEIRTADAARDGAYIDRGVVSNEEVREKLARDPKSGYSGLSLDPADIPNLEEDDGNEDE
jgi:hypothetical protein